MCWEGRGREVERPWQTAAEGGWTGNNREKRSQLGNSKEAERATERKTPAQGMEGAGDSGDM